MIEVKNLTKRFGPVSAVDDVSFTVEARGGGNIVGFLGPNGAGKSTTIRILTCYQPATSGSASVAGFDVFTQSMEVRRNIGYLPENAPLYPEMRVREYLHFRGKLHHMSRPARERAIDRGGSTETQLVLEPRFFDFDYEAPPASVVNAEPASLAKSAPAANKPDAN